MPVPFDSCEPGKSGTCCVQPRRSTGSFSAVPDSGRTTLVPTWATTLETQIIRHLQDTQEKQIAAIQLLEGRFSQILQTQLQEHHTNLHRHLSGHHTANAHKPCEKSEIGNGALNIIKTPQNIGSAPLILPQPFASEAKKETKAICSPSLGVTPAGSRHDLDNAQKRLDKAFTRAAHTVSENGIKQYKFEAKGSSPDPKAADQGGHEGSLANAKAYSKADQPRRALNGPVTGLDREPENTEALQKMEYSLLARCVYSNHFQIAVGAVVVCNSIFIGYHLHNGVYSGFRNEEHDSWEYASDLVFTFLFLIELVMRMIVEQRDFIHGKDKWWNGFDTLIVTTGTIELANFTEFSLTYLRILRVGKVLKVFRIIRVFRFFRELRMMALSILSCFVSVVWAFVLLFLALYVYGVIVLQALNDYLALIDITNPPDPDLIIILQHYFDGIWVTLFSLAQAISGGDSWGYMARPMSEISVMYGLYFTFFICLVVFGLLNVLVGIFVQNATAIADWDREFVIQGEMDKKSEVMDSMRELFLSMDDDGSGTVTWAELKASLGNDQVTGMFQLLQIEPEEAEGLFKLLDIDGGGEVEIEEFIVGCMRLKGPARSLDIATVLYEQKRLKGQMQKFMDERVNNVGMMKNSIAGQELADIANVRATPYTGFEGTGGTPYVSHVETQVRS